MKKKGIIILCSVVAICAIGLIVSRFISWPVDYSDADGDIGKAYKFSREQTSENLANMEELLQTDTTFRDDMVISQMVMQTRTNQFATLVDMSNGAAEGIREFANVLKEMNDALDLVGNVNNSLTESGKNLDAALGGETCPDLSQSTINAALAYTTLQKQNNLANRFIEITDKYLETNKGSDDLKLVRDQWVEYQQMTAALDGDKESAEALAKKGNLLTGEKALSAISQLSMINQLSLINGCHLAQTMNVKTQLASAINAEELRQVVSTIRNAAEIAIQKNTASEGSLRNSQMSKIFCNTVNESLRAFNNNATATRLANAQQDMNEKTLNMIQEGNLMRSTVQLASATNMMRVFNAVFLANNKPKIPSNSFVLCNQIGARINQTAEASQTEKLNQNSNIRPK